MTLKRIGHVSLILFLAFLRLSAGEKSVIQIDSVERCKCAEKCLMPNFVSSVRRIKDSTYVDSTFELIEDVGNVKLKIYPMRCKVKEALDTCELLTTVNVKDACTFFQIPGTMWSTFIYAYSPPFICPFNKGTYVGKNATFIWTSMPMPESYFRSKVEFYTTQKNTYLFSFCVGFKVVRIYSK